MSIFIILLILLAASLTMAIGDVKVNNKEVQPYYKRVLFCLITTSMFISVIAWFILLPIIGLLSVFLL